MLLPDNSEYKPVEHPNMAPTRTVNGHLSVKERLGSYDEIDQTYTEEEALEEASRCLYCPTHWCQKACPAGVPVADFIAKIREKDYEGAYGLIHTASSLPEMCSRLCPQEKQCQSNCTRSICSESVAIGKLERFVADWHQAHAAVEKMEKNGKKIAVIGAGPGGLAAAQRLNEKGYAVTVYERESQAGGLLCYGIPNMKLKKSVLNQKIETMKEQGILFESNIEVDAVLAKQLKATADAVVIAVGASETRKPVIEGADDAKGIYYAVDYLASNTWSLIHSGMKDQANISAKGKNVIIIGGGDTGNDCVGMALRNGCKSVVQIEMMPERVGKDHIWYPYPVHLPETKFDCSQEEYMTVFCKDPHRYASTVTAVKTNADSEITAVTVMKMKPKMSESGRVMMQIIPGTEEELPCEMLIIAAGFTGPEKQIQEAFEAEFSKDSYQTNIENVFACGDCRTGQSLVVKAMVDGQKCAEAVAEYLDK